MGGAWVALYTQNIVCIGFDDFPGDLFLAVHRGGGDDAAGQFQGAQEFGHGGDFVALVPHFALSQHQPALGVPER